jgi:F420H(2)-dependent quinone reductase
MHARVRRALETERTIDITTTGRASGRPRRIEMWFHNLDGELYLTGTPGTRDWYANLVAHPAFTFHLKGTLQADLRARATPILDPARRRTILSRLLDRLGHAEELDAWIRESPLVAVEILEAEPGTGPARPRGPGGRPRPQRGADRNFP